MTPPTNSPRRLRRGAPFPRALTCADTVPRYPVAVPPPLRIGDPGELIAALPALLGFVPERSLVVGVLCHGPRAGTAGIEAVVRFDLDALTGPDAPDRLADCLGTLCVRERAIDLLAVVVDDRGAGTRRRAALFAALDAAGPGLGGLWWVERIVRGAPYRDLRGPHAGTVRDPAASPVAVAQVLDGKQIRRSRRELTDLVAAERGRVDAVLDELAAARARFADALTAAARADREAAYRRGALEWTLWQIAGHADGEPRSDLELAQLAALLADRVLRDALYGLALGEYAGAAEGLWIQLCRVTAGTDRAEAAALAGFSAYLRGDGPLAGIALAAATDADATHPMAVLLEAALQSGLRPERLRRLAESGHAIAAELGVDLGPVCR
ncbi:DUF4192 domain-containing protein [Nocardia thailandica]